MRFTNVTLPMLGPTILFTSVVLTTRAFQAYGEVALLTGGGPDPERPTQTVPYLIYGQNSLVKNDIGLKSTAAVLLFVVLLVLGVRPVPRSRQAGALWQLTPAPPRFCTVRARSAATRC